MIRFDSVSKDYAGRAAVSGFSLSIEQGERVVLVGPSGCGKTTVLRLLAGLAVPTAGRIFIGDRLVSGPGTLIVPPEERNLGFVFQDLALWPHMSVRGNLEFGLKARGTGREERARRIREMLTLVELEHRAGARPGELSGGEQQRVALARALVQRPATLLMDEPLSNLDPELSLRLRADILRLQRDLGFTLLYVTHNRDEALALGTRLVRMSRGRVEAVEPEVPI